jgi:hypothetical protein
MPVTAPASGAGIALAVLIAIAPTRVSAPQCLAARAQPAEAREPPRSARSRFTSLPVSMRTGQAVWHIPSAAQHDTLSGRDGEVLAGTYRLAVAALHAPVDLLLHGGGELEVGQRAIGVLVQ